MKPEEMLLPHEELEEMPSSCQGSLEQVNHALMQGISTLSEREQDVIIRRYGLDGREYETYRAIGERHGVSAERARQIEVTALRRLRAQDRLDAISEALPAHMGYVSEKVDNIRQERREAVLAKEAAKATEADERKQYNKQIDETWQRLKHERALRQQDAFKRRLQAFRSGVRAWDALFAEVSQ